MLTAALCQDGFVLVGSVAGQRYWSTMLPSEATVTCGAWTPDDLQVYVATAQGGLIVMDLHGNIVSKVGSGIVLVLQILEYRAWINANLAYYIIVSYNRFLNVKVLVNQEKAFTVIAKISRNIRFKF